MSKSEIQKNILKIISARKKIGENFSTWLRIQSLFLPWTMDENDFGAQYQPCSFGTFLGFDSDYHPDLYGDMAITEKPEIVEPQKAHSTQKG